MREPLQGKEKELRRIVDERLTAFIRELEDADWSADDVAFEIEFVLNEKWLAKAKALRTARETVPNSFVSDGNEG